jgi:hypothetical protein
MRKFCHRWLLSLVALLVAAVTIVPAGHRTAAVLASQSGTATTIIDSVLGALPLCVTQAGDENNQPGKGSAEHSCVVCTVADLRIVLDGQKSSVCPAFTQTIFVWLRIDTLPSYYLAASTHPIRGPPSPA